MIRENPSARAAHAAKSLQGLIDDGSESLSVEVGREVAEVKSLVHFIGAYVVSHLGQRHDPGFCAEHAVWPVAFENLPPVPIHLVYALLIPERPARSHRWVFDDFLVRKAISFDQSVGYINAEPVNTAVEPEPQYPSEQFPHLGVVPIEVRLA